jgi:hypothetical protein
MSLLELSFNEVTQSDPFGEGTWAHRFEVLSCRPLSHGLKDGGDCRIKLFVYTHFTPPPPVTEEK